MIRFIGKSALITALLAVAVHGATVGEMPDVALQSARIFVRTYDYASVPPHILGQAKTHAARVFERAAIEVVWLPDPLHAKASDALAVRSGLLDHERRFRELAVRVYPSKMSRRLGMANNVFGYALQPEGRTGFGTTAITFYEKAEILAKLGVASRSVTLGHIIAHEMGHLLLGNNSHSQSGIMKVPWSRFELKRAATGILNFTPKEASRMREGLVAREKYAALRAARITTR